MSDDGGAVAVPPSPYGAGAAGVVAPQFGAGAAVDPSLRAIGAGQPLAHAAAAAEEHPHVEGAHNPNAPVVVAAAAAAAASAADAAALAVAKPPPPDHPRPPTPKDRVLPPAAAGAAGAADGQPGAPGGPGSRPQPPVAPLRPLTKEEIAKITAENAAKARASNTASSSVADFFAKAAQWGLQAVGSRVASPDPPELHQMFFRLARIEAELEELRTVAVHYHGVRRVVAADRLKFNNAVAACGSHSKLGNTHASDVVRQFAAAAHRLESVQDDLDRAFYSLIVMPINELLIGEIRTANALKKTYDSLHLEFDSRTTRYNEYKEDPKVPETAKRVAARKAAKSELDRAVQQFDGAKDQFKIVFAAIERKRNAIFAESLSLYLKSEAVHHNNATAALEVHTQALSNFPPPGSVPGGPAIADAAAAGAGAGAGAAGGAGPSVDVKSPAPAAAGAGGIAISGGGPVVVSPAFGGGAAAVVPASPSAGAVEHDFRAAAAAHPEPGSDSVR